MDLKDIFMLLAAALGAIGFGLGSWALIRVVSLTAEVAVLKSQNSDVSRRIEGIERKVDKVLILLTNHREH